MIRTEQKAPMWVNTFSLDLIRNGNEKVGVRAAKAEVLAPLAKMHVNNKIEYEDVVDDYASWGRGIVARMPNLSKQDVRVAYEDTYTEYAAYQIDKILYNREYGDIGRVMYNISSSSEDRGASDKRYHMFKVADLEVFLLAGEPRETLVIFRDLDTGRDFIAKSSATRLHN